MANVLFKRGLETALMNLGSYTDGCFYLTEDTHRLYVGQTITPGQNAILVPVNEGVVTVANIQSLPTVGIPGSFYYTSTENVLCVYNGNKWVQVNSNTNTYYKVSSIELSKATDFENKKIELQPIIIMDLYDHSGVVETKIENSSITITGSKIEITNEDFTALIEGAQVGLSKALADKVFTITTSGTGADSSQKVDFTAGENVTFTATTDGIKISSTNTNTTYGMEARAEGTDKAKVVLKDSDGLESEVAFTAGEKLNVVVNNSAITYEHETANVVRGAATEGNVGADRKITVVTGVTDDGYGHMSEVVTKTFILPEDKDIYVNGASYDEPLGKDHGVLTLTRTEGTEITVDLGLSSKKIIDTIQSEIESTVKNLNALSYKGTVGTDGTITELPVTAAIGDMYMASSESNTLEPVTYKIGDLIIATGEEEDGIIPEDKLVWTVVPAGNDLHTDTQYRLITDVSEDGVPQLILKNFNTGEVVNTINFLDDQIIKVTKGVSDDTFKFEHADKTTTQTTSGDTINPSHGGEFNVVTAVTADTKGHLSEVVTSKVVLPADNDTQSSLAAGVENGIASIILTENLNGLETEDVVTITNSNEDITITSGDTDQIKIGHAAHNGTKITQEKVDLSSGQEINIVTDVTVGTNGHIDSLVVMPVKLPVEKEYDLIKEVSTANNTATISTALKDQNGAETTADYQITSNNLTVASSNNIVTIDMLWGSF